MNIEQIENLQKELDWINEKLSETKENSPEWRVFYEESIKLKAELRKAIDNERTRPDARDSILAFFISLNKALLRCQSN